jgi:hypothetical protein
MNDFKNEISRIISICPFDLKLIEDKEGKIIVDKVTEVFVKNNPRALWLDLKYKSISVDYEDDYPYKKIPELFNTGELLYLLVDYFNETFYILEGYIEAIIVFIEDCTGLDEYYIVDNDFTKLVCENDHDELLFIDVFSNQKIE